MLFLIIVQCGVYLVVTTATMSRCSFSVPKVELSRFRKQLAPTEPLCGQVRYRTLFTSSFEVCLSAGGGLTAVFARGRSRGETSCRALVECYRRRASGGDEIWLAPHESRATNAGRREWYW